MIERAYHDSLIMNVTLSQLRAFERIVRLGSFHAAARDLHLSQPSVSQRIRELEGVLQTPLFVRRGPRVSLTLKRVTLQYEFNFFELIPS